MKDVRISAAVIATGKGYNAEVYISVHKVSGNGASRIEATTFNRVVQVGLETREAAYDSVADWVREKLFPVVEALPKAKP